MNTADPAQGSSATVEGSPANHDAVRFRRSVPAAVLAVLLFSAALAAVALFSQQWVVVQAARAVPGEGLHWSVAQYQIAHQRLKQELRALAAGETVDHREVAQRWAVLASRASILVEPSAVNTLLSEVKGFAQATARIKELHQRIAPLLDQAQSLSRTDAQQILQAFKSADDEALLSQLGNEARQAELVAKEMLISDLSRRLSWVWVGFGLCWTVLALWLLSAVRSARRYTQAAADRLQAMNAMTLAVNTKRRFLSMISHELRSPLQSIVTAAESLTQDIALGQSRPQSAVALQRFRRATSGLQAQLCDLLTIARSDSEGPGLKLETFDTSALVGDVCADYEESEARLQRADLPRLLAMAGSGAVIGPVALAGGLQHTSGTSASLMLTLEALFTAVFNSRSGSQSSGESSMYRSNENNAPTTRTAVTGPASGSRMAATTGTTSTS